MSNLQKWPKDWDKHFFQYCDLYFYDKDITFNKDSFSTASKDNNTFLVSADFSRKRFLYEVEISTDGSGFSCSISLITLNPNQLTIQIIDGDIVAVTDETLNDIAGFGGQMDLQFIIDTIEFIIRSDSEGRDKNDGGDDPFEPSPPVGSNLLKA